MLKFSTFPDSSRPSSLPLRDTQMPLHRSMMLPAATVLLAAMAIGSSDPAWAVPSSSPTKRPTSARLHRQATKNITDPSHPARCAGAAPTQRRRMNRNRSCVGKKSKVRSSSQIKPHVQGSASPVDETESQQGPWNNNTDSQAPNPLLDLPSEAPSESGSASVKEGGAALPLRFFSPSSIWNTPVPSDAPVDPLSSQLVAHFVGEVIAEKKAHKGPGINTTKWSVPIYTVPSNQPMVRVMLRSQPLRMPSATLASAFEAVPLPPTAQPAAGTDRPLVVWQPSTDSMWEFWELSQGSHGWQTAWGGAMQSVSSNPGVYGPSAWPGADSSWGASASSLSIAGGLITFDDLKRGMIDHALAMAIPEVRAGFYASPANRDDGTSTDPLSLPEGAHLRLDPHLNLSSLDLPRPTLMLAEAAQRYGIIVRDRAGTINFYGQDPTPTGANPYLGAEGYFEGFTPGQLMAAFPWEHLQVLKVELHES